MGAGATEVRACGGQAVQQKNMKLNFFMIPSRDFSLRGQHHHKKKLVCTRVVARRSRCTGRATEVPTCGVIGTAEESGSRDNNNIFAQFLSSNFFKKTKNKIDRKKLQKRKIFLKNVRKPRPRGR